MKTYINSEHNSKKERKRMRLDKFLVQVELGSRSQVKDYIKKGRIAVNSAIVNRPEFQIDEMQDSITCANFSEPSCHAASAEAICPQMNSAAGVLSPDDTV